MQEQAKEQVLGAQGNLWTEQITTSRQAEYLLFPRLMLLAQQVWRPQEAERILAMRPILVQLCEALNLNCYRGE